MANPITVTTALTVAADSDGIAQSQTPLAAGNLTINGALASGGTASLTAQRRVLITSAGNDSDKTFTVYGTNGSGNAIYEAVTGGNVAAVSTTLDFLTVTRVAVSAATAGAVTVGTSSVGSSNWIVINQHVAPDAVSIGCVVTGTVNYTVQYTYAPDPFGMLSAPTSQVATWNHSSMTAQTTTQDGTLDHPCTAVRLVINSGTGSVAMTVLQAGIRGN